MGFQGILPAKCVKNLDFLVFLKQKFLQKIKSKAAENPSCPFWHLGVKSGDKNIEVLWETQKRPEGQTFGAWAWARNTSRKLIPNFSGKKKTTASLE